VIDPAKNLSHEWDRQKSLEQRGITVITSTGTFVTLIFAISAVITKFKGAHKLEPAKIVLIVISMSIFLLAGLFGIWVNKPKDYGAVDRKLLEVALSRASSDNISQLRHQAALTIGHARNVNAVKARLQWAIVFQVVAVAVLVAAVILIVVMGRG